MDLTFTMGQERFNVRTAAVILSGGRLLLQGSRGYPFLIPPGGRCTLHESSRDALARELREELGCEAEVGRLLWVIENFFALDGFRVHELTFVYAASLSGLEEPLDEAEGDFPGAEGDAAIFFRWVPLTGLEGLEIYPEVLRTRCASLPATTEHLLVDQRTSTASRVEDRHG